MLDAQALERGNDLVLTHLDCIGDHTRGLFEAEASIGVSATHALENVQVILLGHRSFLPQTSSSKDDLRMNFQTVCWLGTRHRPRVKKLLDDSIHSVRLRRIRLSAS